MSSVTFCRSDRRQRTAPFDANAILLQEIDFFRMTACQLKSQSSEVLRECEGTWHQYTATLPPLRPSKLFRLRMLFTCQLRAAS